MAKKKVLIIGAGLGGLTTAIRLAHKGFAVEIVEKQSTAGGRLNSFTQDGFTFDTGPSFFSMSYEFTDFFKSINEPNPLVFNALDPLYSVNFAKSDRTYHIYKDLDRLSKEFKAIEPEFRKSIDAYLKQAGEIFHDTEYKIVKRNYTSVVDYLIALATVPLKHTPKLFRTMWTELGRYFNSDEVKIIFSLVAFFLGATPFNTPAVYSLLNYTELVHDGYWNVQGGMYKITETMLQLCDKKGVKIHYNTEITAYQSTSGVIDGFIDTKENHWESDIYVANSDAAGFRHFVMKREAYSAKKLDAMHWTLAPFTIYLGVKGKLDNVNHHNYFLGDNFNAYADTIFTATTSPEKPYYYVNVSSKSNPECAPYGCENIFILCPVPDLRYKSDWSDANALADTIISDLGQRIGYDLHQNTLSKTIWTPVDWKDKYNLYQGSGLGLAHDLNQVGGFRPSNKDEKYDNLFYVGASTVPGTGLPIVVISSKLVTEKFVKSMMQLYNKTTMDCSTAVTQNYSTSFTLGIKTLDKKFHNPIYSVYGFVRLADEIVDTFYDYDQKALLADFIRQTWEAIEVGFSLNPILHAFQLTVNQYNISHDLIHDFLYSMEMDLSEQSYERVAFNQYVYGSAEVVGLMCLTIFTEGDQALFEKLKSPARSLGGAFQKINFLRDIKSDFAERGRTYFPGIDLNNFSNEDKLIIEKRD